MTDAEKSMPKSNSPMPYHLKSELEDLSRSFETLKDELQNVVEDLEKGVPPDKGVAYKLRELRVKFDGLRKKATREVQEERFSNPCRELAELEELVDQASPSFSELYEKALDRLQRLSNVVDEGASDDETLSGVREEAESLITKIHEPEENRPHEEIEGFVEGSHPLSSFENLAFQESELGDDEWLEARKIVEDQFHTKTFLAATRGRVEVKNGSGKTSPADENADGGGGGTSTSQHDEEESGQSEPEKTEKPETDRKESSEEHISSEPDRFGEEDNSDVDEEKRSSEDKSDVQTAQAPDTEDSKDADPDEEGNKADDAKLEEERLEVVESGSNGRKDASQEHEGPSGDSNVSVSTARKISPTQEDALEVLAKQILDEGVDTAGSVEALAWSLLHNHLDGLAFRFTQGVEEKGTRIFPSRLLRDFAIGRHVQGRSGELARHLQFADTKEVLNQHDALEAESLWCLVFCATLRPALHAPAMTSALDVIELLQEHSGPDILHRILQTVGSFVKEHYRPISSRALNGTSAETFEEELAEYQSDFEEWVSNVQKRSAPYWKATQAWRKQFDEGPIYKIVEKICGESLSTGDILEVRDRLKEFRDLDPQRTFQRSMGVNEELEGKALKWLKNSFQEFESWVTGWVDLAEQHSGEEEEPYVEESYGTVERLQDLSMEAEERLSDSTPRAPTAQVAFGRTLEVLDDLSEHLKGTSPLQSEPSVHEILGIDLLRIPDLQLQEDLAPKGDAAQNLEEILDALKNGYPNWEHAFREHAERGDHQSTEKILHHLRQRGSKDSRKGVDVEKLSQERDESIDSFRREMEQYAAEARRQVERSFRAGYLNQDERASYLSRVRSVRDEISETTAFHRTRDALKLVKSEIEEKKNQALQKTQERLHSEEVQSTLSDRPEDRKRIEEAIDQEDVRTADAYIHRVLEGHGIPSREKKNTALEDFFPERLDSIAGELSEPERIQTLLQDLRSEDEESPDGPIDFGICREEQRRSAEIADTWFQARRRQKIEEEDLERILVSLGFSPRSVEIESMGKTIPPGRKSRWAVVDIDIPSRRNVPVPEYGSSTNGHYRILLAYGNPAIEELADDIEHIRPDKEKAMLAFHFGNIAPAERRQLSNLCRERRTDFAVVDQALFLYLLGQPRSSRLRSLFECTLPFSFLQPYSESASRIPREMFYGREREIEEIHRARGPSIVYGGRQLGKTVLLRRAKRLFHDPPERISSWVDLRRYGIDSKDPKSVWPIIVDELKELGVFDKGEMSRDAKPDTISRKVESWLNGNQQRRILLLLDEADSFFSKDQQNGFEQTSSLKGLMESTKGRFKVVFAGLHNVLRTTSAPNQPLAHLAEPICVGPLLEGGEWESARELVAEPLRALGYRFEPEEDLITSILSLTNYYPSLIQLYCRHLLEEISERSALSQPDGPPYTIGRSEVQHSYDKRELMRKIRDKFQLTLELDPRYEVLAYFIGYETRKADEETIDGFEVDWIANKARSFWPDGFRGSDSRDHVQALLDEMVGLGVLRSVSERRYALRSPNVLRLLGNKGEMEEVLLKDRPPVPEYDPKTHRRFYERENRIAPLTEHQHSLLKQKGAWPQSSSHGVSVIYGTKAAGLEDVKPFLEDMSTDNTFYTADSLKSAAELDEWMRDRKAGRSKSEVTLLFVPQEAPWGDGWVEKAVRQAQRLDDRRAALRIAFLADPEHLSTMCCESEGDLFSSGNNQVIPIQLQPWDGAALRDWLVERGKKPTKSELKEISRVTGNWPILLRMLEEDIRRDPSSLLSEVEALSQKIEGSDVAEDLLEDFGLPKSTRRKILQTLALLGSDDSPDGVGMKEVVEIAGESYGDAVAQRVEPALRWGSLVGIASVGRRNTWKVDHTVKRLLLSAGA